MMLYYPDAGDADDRLDFLSGWNSYLLELSSMGSEIIASTRTMQFYLGLFELYSRSPDNGVCLFAQEDTCEGPTGIILWGGPVELPWDHTLGKKLAQGWGTYVKPDARGKGTSRALRDAAVKHLYERGFDAVLGSAVHNNTVGVESGDSYGFEPLHDTRVLRL